MNKKLQIFVSSTYTDLLTERQAAVEAILRAGHIPAGMELFAAGDKNQLDTICRWIDESDIYMLILGARYGSIDPESGKSYTQLEYEYALAKGKRFFAVVLSDAANEAKVKAHGSSVIERERPDALKAFRTVVTSKICRIVEDSKDIKLAVHETLLEFLRQHTFDGWVSGKELLASEEMTREIAVLTRENAKLRAQVEAATPTKAPPRPDQDFEGIAELLGHEHAEYGGKSYSILEWFYFAKDALVTGVENRYNMSEQNNFFFFTLGSRLSIHGLVEDEKVAGVQWRRMKTTKKGNEFLVFLQKRIAAGTKSRSGVSASADAGKSHESAAPAPVPPKQIAPPAGDAATKPKARKTKPAGRRPTSR